MLTNQPSTSEKIALAVLSKYCANPAPSAANEFPEDEESATLLSRVWTFDSYIKPLLDGWVNWISSSKENTNFTYGLTALNEKQLAGFVNAITQCGISKCLGYFEELKEDTALRDHLRRKTLESPFRNTADLDRGYGRRIGWYAFVRITKPRLVVETGVDKGLGSCVLAAALMRNAAEGFDGRYIGTDINPLAGYLFSDSYSSMGKILYGDSLESLSSLTDVIDIFINDSDHSGAYEAKEYQAVHPKLNYGSIILGDNAHATSSLFDYALRENKKFLFFSEKPEGHFYPGAGIGASF
jgi:Methyltransferase domain